jgi:hypothetical protein
MHWAALGSVVVALVGVAVVLAWLPARTPSHQPVPDSVETLAEQLELADA